MPFRLLYVWLCTGYVFGTGVACALEVWYGGRRGWWHVYNIIRTQHCSILVANVKKKQHRALPDFQFGGVAYVY